MGERGLDAAFRIIENATLNHFPLLRLVGGVVDLLRGTRTVSAVGVLSAELKAS